MEKNMRELLELVKAKQSEASEEWQSFSAQSDEVGMGGSEWIGLRMRQEQAYGKERAYMEVWKMILDQQDRILEAGDKS